MKIDSLVKKELTQSDWDLVVSAMMETTVSRTSEALMCESVMPKKAYDRDMNDAKRLEYLINVFKGTKEYK